MPQMFPTMWMLLYIFFIILLLMMTSKIYFSSINLQSTLKTNKMLSKKKNWLW